MVTKDRRNVQFFEFSFGLISIMSNLPTPHISAKMGEIAQSVLMPGDPLRAKFIAENFLTDVKCINKVRNMLGFTGKYNGKTVSVMGSGMGMASIGIYSYELFKFYGVENIVRIGSAGAISDEINLKDIVIAMGACTDSNYALQYNLTGSYAPIASFGLLSSAVEAAGKLGARAFVGNVYSSDVFYSGLEVLEDWKKMGVLAVEMESAALYMNAARLGKNALCILTISDRPLRAESISSEEREKGFGQMVQIALDTVLK